MDIFTDAPIAQLDHDTAITSSTEDVEERASSVDYTRSEIDLDCEMYLNGSLSDLVIGFDDVISGLVVADSVASANHPQPIVQQSKTTLSDVKFWWKEACASASSSVYPLEKAPSVPRLYEEFELADADGVTEDPHSEINDEVHLLGKNDARSDRPTRSLVSTNSFASSRTSLRSTTPDTLGGLLAGPVSLDPQPIEPPTPTMESAKTATDKHSPCDGKEVHVTGLTNVKGFSPLESVPTDLTALQLRRLSMVKLNLLAQHLTAAIMRLSDSLVDSLASREELVMLREASDDFILLLKLLHHRRARASRAALIATAKARLRFRKFTNITFPWWSKQVQTPYSNGSSASLASHDLSHRSMEPRDPTTDSVDMNSQSGTVAYYNSLQLQSKQRRPRSRPFTTVKTNRGPPSQAPNGVANGERHEHNNGCDGKHYTSGQGEPEDSVPSQTSTTNVKVDSLKRAADRFEELRRVCLSGNWPNGQPQHSQCLTLQVPRREYHSSTVTLRDLRLLNQILHHAILEKPSTPVLVENYSQALRMDNQLRSWISTSGYQIKEGNQTSSRDNLSVVFCDNR